uniref:MazG-like family protein n=1 Tax=Burkholderia anthina TaxID=179879 RepID=UPI00158F410E|nr:MazG-like family protein [Burkholderia anthina]
MSYHNGLSFDTLRGANAARLPTFRNARGEIAHAKHDGSDWSPGDWMTAVVGELGEAANIMKKLRRGDYGNEGSDANIAAYEALAREFADVVIYLDILAMQFTIDLGKAVHVKFNEVSKRVGSPIYIGHDGDWHLDEALAAKHWGKTYGTTVATE